MRNGHCATKPRCEMRGFISRTSDEGPRTSPGSPRQPESCLEKPQTSPKQLARGESPWALEDVNLLRAREVSTVDHPDRAANLVRRQVHENLGGPTRVVEGFETEQVSNPEKQ